MSGLTVATVAGRVAGTEEETLTVWRDIPFTFGTFDRCGWGAFVGADDDAVELGRTLRRAWAGFGRGEEPWPATDESRPTMVFDRRSGVEHDPRGAVRRAWRAATGSVTA